MKRLFIVHYIFPTVVLSMYADINIFKSFGIVILFYLIVGEFIDIVLDFVRDNKL